MISVVFQDCLILPYTVAENVSLRPLADTDTGRIIQCLRLAGIYDDIAARKTHSTPAKAIPVMFPAFLSSVRLFITCERTTTGA